MSSQTIVDCFSKAGFTAENVDSDLENDPFRDLVSTIDELRLVDASQVPEDVTSQDLLSMDEQVIASQPYMTDQEIIDTVEDVQTIEDDEPSDDEDGVQSEEVLKKPTSKEV